MSGTYGSITGDALLREVEELCVRVLVSNNISERNTVASVLNTVLIGEDTKGNSKVVGATVRPNVPATILVLEGLAFNVVSNVELFLLSFFTIVSTVLSVVIADVDITVCVLLFNRKLTEVTHGTV